METLDLILPCGIKDPKTEEVLRNITIREFGGEEEDILRESNTKNSKNGNAIDRMLRNCILDIGGVVERPRIADLYNRMRGSDRSFLLIRERQISVDNGDIFRARLTCTQCREISTHTVDLSTLPVLEQKDEHRGRDTYEAQLSKGQKFTYRPLYVSDTAHLIQIEKDGTDKGTLELMLQIQSFDEKPVTSTTIKGLSWRQRTEIRKLMDLTEGGIDTLLEADCRECGATFQTLMPVMDRSFFFPGDLTGKTPPLARPARSSGTMLSSLGHGSVGNPARFVPYPLVNVSSMSRRNLDEWQRKTQR